MTGIVDLSYLKIVCEGDKDFMREMIETFIDTFPENIQKIKEASLSGDWAQMAKAAHKIKPSIAFVGLRPLKESILSIEAMAREGRDTEGILQKIKEIELLAQQAVAELQKVLEGF